MYANVGSSANSPDSRYNDIPIVLYCWRFIGPCKQVLPTLIPIEPCHPAEPNRSTVRFDLLALQNQIKQSSVCYNVIYCGLKMDSITNIYSIVENQPWVLTLQWKGCS